jgi:hypothetical protein
MQMMSSLPISSNYYNEAAATVAFNVLINLLNRNVTIFIVNIFVEQFLNEVIFGTTSVAVG